ncbi:uncharacterized protein VTP21DRAFT_11594 [Calcarisporiella thermophila]|uniref:uncharacterized protein n=1 Tax=Calcarisporiella thermophila TaxID=911321 RepID=UPI00374295DE
MSPRGLGGRSETGHAARAQSDSSRKTELKKYATRLGLSGNLFFAAPLEPNLCLLHLSSLGDRDTCIPLSSSLCRKSTDSGGHIWKRVSIGFFIPN